MLTGLVKLDGQALSDQRLLLISGDMMKFLGSTTSAEDGAFAIDVPAGHDSGQVVLLLKIQGPVVALAQRVIDLESEGWGPHEFLIDTTDGSFHNVEGEVASTSGWPPYLNVFVNPVHVESIPEPLEKFFRWQDEQVLESTFYKLKVDGHSFNLRFRSGTYKIGADHLNYFRPSMENPDFENYVATRAEADGESQPLQGERYGGYLMEVKRDRQIVLTIEMVPDEELSPQAL